METKNMIDEIVAETSGIIYIATGKKYIEMAIRSARSVLKHNPGLKIHLFGDWQEHGFDFSRDTTPFTSVGGVEDAHYRSKVDYMARTPFDRSMYLDTDTRVVADIRHVFRLLDRFDIALAHAPERTTRLHNWSVEIPESFPQYNSGVIVYKKSEPVLSVLQEWKQAFHEANFRSDQVTLRELLWKSSLRIATLAPEYNLRFFKYLFLWNRREARAKILHLHWYRRGILWFAYPWYISALIFYRRLTGKQSNKR